MQRREAREFVLSLLYRHEFVETPLADLLDEVDTGDQRSYVERVYLGILDRRAELDALIGERTVGWRFERLALIDRNILRLGAFEILYLPEVPPQVALDEAVELAKKYGTENARSFINGILDRIWKESGRHAGAEREAGCRGAAGEAGATGEGPRGKRASAYLRAKERLGKAVGIAVERVSLTSPTTETLLRTVRDLACDPDVPALLVEAPLPDGVDTQAIRDALPLEKDVDGAGTAALGRLLAGGGGYLPATAEAVVTLLHSYGIRIAGRRVVVVGRSLVVGRPLALLLLAEDATVTVCHSRTTDLAAITREADLVCVAVGRPGLLTGEMIRPGAAVVDIGTSSVDGKIVGDAHWASVSEVAGAVSPVPGGVGPLTNVLLLEHVAEATERAAR